MPLLLAVAAIFFRLVRIIRYKRAISGLCHYCTQWAICWMITVIVRECKVWTAQKTFITFRNTLWHPCKTGLLPRIFRRTIVTVTSWPARIGVSSARHMLIRRTTTVAKRTIDVNLRWKSFCLCPLSIHCFTHTSSVLFFWVASCINNANTQLIYSYSAHEVGSLIRDSEWNNRACHKTLISSGERIPPNIIYNLWARRQKFSPALSQAEKNLKNVGLKWRQIFSLPVKPKCLGPALLLRIPILILRVV